MTDRNHSNPTPAATDELAFRSPISVPGPGDPFERTPIRHAGRMLDLDATDRADYLAELARVHSPELAEATRVYVEQQLELARGRALPGSAEEHLARLETMRPDAAGVYLKRLRTARGDDFVDDVRRRFVNAQLGRRPPGDSCG